MCNLGEQGGKRYHNTIKRTTYKFSKCKGYAVEVILSVSCMLCFGTSQAIFGEGTRLTVLGKYM